MNLSQQMVFLGFGVLLAPLVNASKLELVSDRAGSSSVIAAPANGASYSRACCQSQLSADGRFVSFVSEADNLVDGDHNELADIFVRDRLRGLTQRVSTAMSGAEADGDSASPGLSADGRRVVFQSFARNLVDGDSNQRCDVFVRDLALGQLIRVSVGNNGAQANGHSAAAAISADGSQISFSSAADNLAPGDVNGSNDVFVRDLKFQETRRISQSSSGQPGNGRSVYSSISSDGRFVAFESLSNNLVPADHNGHADIFLHDRQNSLTTRVSVSSAGVEGLRDSSQPSISADGRFIAFVSGSPNLVPDDFNGTYDVFVHDRMRGLTQRVSRSSEGLEGNAISDSPSISADGNRIVFVSEANLLRPGSTPGLHQVWLHERLSGRTTLVSADARLAIGNEPSLAPGISADGTVLSFQSGADNWSLSAGLNGEWSDLFVATLDSR